jgi:hypothetical protein
LTVTKSRERVKHFVAACHSLFGGDSRLFLFADLEALGGDDILTHEWMNGRGEIVRLFATRFTDSSSGSVSQ